MMPLKINCLPASASNTHSDGNHSHSAYHPAEKLNKFNLHKFVISMPFNLKLYEFLSNGTEHFSLCLS